MLQLFVMRIKISAIYLNFFFITAKQYCTPISSSIGLTAVPPSGTVLNPKGFDTVFILWDSAGIQHLSNKQNYAET